MCGEVRRRDVQQVCRERTQGTPARRKNSPWAGAQGGSAGQLGRPQHYRLAARRRVLPSGYAGRAGTQDRHWRHRLRHLWRPRPCHPDPRLALHGAEALCSQGNSAFARSRGLIGGQRPVRCPETQAEGERFFAFFNALAGVDVKQCDVLQ